MTKQSERRGFSFQRVLFTTLPVAVLTALAFGYMYQQQRAEQRGYEQGPSKQFGLTQPTSNRLHTAFVDSDGDLLADRPVVGECVTPETLYFSYIPGEGVEHQAETWNGLMEAISEATGIPVEFKVVNSVDDQFDAVVNTELHITGVNTGAVPEAVNSCGFIPMFVIGNADGSFGYTMKFIVPADSPIKSIADVKSQRITFTSTTSNSGFKAPLVMLKYDFDMEPGIDYEFNFSTSHIQSIVGVAAKDVKIATVASDLLERAIKRGDVEADSIRVIHTSERFPSATLGVAHNLPAELSDKIATAITNYSFQESPLESAIGVPKGSRFIRVSYKDEWALIRRTDDALGVIHRELGPNRQSVLAKAAAPTASAEQTPAAEAEPNVEAEPALKIEPVEEDHSSAEGAETQESVEPDPTTEDAVVEPVS